MNEGKVLEGAKCRRYKLLFISKEIGSKDKDKFTLFTKKNIVRSHINYLTDGP